MDDEDQQHLKELLRTYQRRLRFLERQEALHGLSTSFGTLIEIEDTKARIAEIQQRLEKSQLLEEDDILNTVKDTKESINLETRSVASVPAIINPPFQETKHNSLINTPSIYIRTSLTSFIVTVLSAIIGWIIISGVSYILSPLSYSLAYQLLVLSSVFLYLLLAQLLPYNLLISIRYNLLLIFIGTLIIPIITHFTGMSQSMPTTARYFSNLAQSFGVYGIVTRTLLWLNRQRRIQEAK